MFRYIHYMRRVLRILPPFYLVLSVAVALTLLHALKGSLLLPAVLAQALHYCNYWGAFHGIRRFIPDGTAVYWSLAIEEHFYAYFFPRSTWFLTRLEVMRAARNGN